MNLKKHSESIYLYFSDKEGNQHIAGLYAIEKILTLIKLNKPKRILEIGLGIGSISYAILNYYKKNNLSISYDGTEDNEYCLSQLEPNLGEFYTQLNIYKNIHAIHHTDKYDFVIIDGTDHSLDLIKDLISPHGVIFIEGHRAGQTTKMKETFPKHKYTECISDFKNPDYGPFPKENWSGGGQLIYINPTPQQFIHFIEEKIKTSFKYRIKRKIVG
jgi:precorrin-6B methylase 2